ncbi:MAG: class I SAM-dependent methyltransferase [Acidimicrobiales bacterium]
MAAGRKFRKLSKAVDSVPFWWHSIELGDGVVSDGQRSADDLAAEWESLGLPDLRDKSVIDVGAWDGYFSFRAEEAGAARVVALDHYAWSLDLARKEAYDDECRAAGTVPVQYHAHPGIWRPEELPGKAGFDTAHRARDSRVESVVGDYLRMDLERLGTFDVVLFLGVLDRMRNPLLALERVARLARDLLVVETEAVAVPGFEHHGFAEFFETNELNGDPTVWWAATRHATMALCRSAGFAQVDSPAEPANRPTRRDALHRYRLVVRAWK